jgi:hypothetical protein
MDGASGFEVLPTLVLDRKHRDNAGFRSYGAHVVTIFCDTSTAASFPELHGYLHSLFKETRTLGKKSSVKNNGTH